MKDWKVRFIKKRTVPNNPVDRWGSDAGEQYCINDIHYIEHKDKRLERSDYQYGNYVVRHFRRIKPGLLMESTTWLGISPIAKKQEEKGYYERLER